MIKRSPHTQDKLIGKIYRQYERFLSSKKRKQSIRLAVRDWLYPRVEKMVTNQLKWKKMPKDLGSDPIDFLYAYFRNGDGKRLIQMIRDETKNEFSRDEVMYTFIHFIYKLNIDYLTIKIEVESKPDYKSIWDKISEEGQV